MISAEDCEFIKKFEVANTEEKQAILTAEGHQVNGLSVFLSVPKSCFSRLKTLSNIFERSCSEWLEVKKKIV